MAAAPARVVGYGSSSVYDPLQVMLTSASPTADRWQAASPTLTYVHGTPGAGNLCATPPPCTLLLTVWQRQEHVACMIPPISSPMLPHETMPWCVHLTCHHQLLAGASLAGFDQHGCLGKVIIRAGSSSTAQTARQGKQQQQQQNRLVLVDNVHTHGMGDMPSNPSATTAIAASAAVVAALALLAAQTSFGLNTAAAHCCCCHGLVTSVSLMLLLLLLLTC